MNPSARVKAEKPILLNKVYLRIGVYANAQRESDVVERFVRAKIAADRMKDDPDKLFVSYDEAKEK